MNTVTSVTSKNVQYEIGDEKARREKLDRTELPSNLSYFLNDTGFIDNTVNNLINYYRKSETYSKEQLDALFSDKIVFSIVQTLPTENISTSTIYFVPRTVSEQSQSDVYDEYIYTSGQWELIGNTFVDLSDYYTKSQTNTQISSAVATETQNRQTADNTLQSNIDALSSSVDTLSDSLSSEISTRASEILSLENRVDDVDDDLDDEVTRSTNAESALSDRIDVTESHLSNTNNPHSVTKAQVGLGNVTNVATTSTITNNSNENITSGAVYSALQNKVDKVSGKGLSDQNFTYAEKTKLAGLSNYDDTSLSNRVTATENAITTLNGNSSVAGSVDKKIADALAGVTQIDFQIVQTLPASGTKGVIYFVVDTLGEENTYNEYVWVNNGWELIGQTLSKIDLSDYYKKAEVNALVSVKQDKITVSNDTSALTDSDSFDETPAGTNQTATKRRLLSSLWTYIKGKMTGSVSTVVDSELTASRALISNSSKKIAVSSVTSTELGYVSGVTSSIQTQLNGKVGTGRKVNGHALSADVTVSKSDVGLDDVANIDQSKAIKSITRSGTTFTATCLDDTTFTFTQQDTNTTYSPATTSANGLMSKEDKTKLNGIEDGAQVNVIIGVKGDSETDYRVGNVNITKANIGLGNVNNTADSNKVVASAEKLTTARKVYVKLGTASTTETKDFSGDTAIPVNGTLGVANGGTGQTTATNIVNETIQSGISDASADFADTTSLITTNQAGYSSTNKGLYRRPVSALWNWLKAKFSITTSGSGNAITALSYSNGVFTATKGSTFLISHQDISGKANVSETGYSLAVSGKTVSLKNKAGTVLSSITTQDTTYSNATSTTDGLMSATDKNAIRYYGTCATSRATNAKVVTCSNFVLETGCRILVKFTDTAGSAPTSGNITLNVNSTGAKNVYNKNNSQMTYAYSGEFRNNRYCEFVYDGTNFIWVNYDSNTTYTTISQAEITAGTSTSNRVVTPKLLVDNFAKKDTATQSSAGLMSASDKTKLDSISGSTGGIDFEIV